MKTKAGLPMGLDVDLAQFMASAMGVELSLHVKPFAELLPALEAGEVDMVISGMTITPERNKRVAFVGPYHVTGKSFLTKFESIVTVENPAELNSAKWRFAALKGSTSAELVKQLMPNAALFETADYDTAVAMVLQDKVDALVSDYHACVVALLRHPNSGLVSVITPFTYEPLGIALPPGDAHLINWVENFLNTMDASDELAKLKFKWIEDASWLNMLP
jgi:polar amino acid transport system substrate-binding protein